MVIDIYTKKLTTKEDAVSIIESGNRIYVSGNAATPYPLVSALAARKDSLRDVDVVHVLLLGDDPLSAPGMEGHFRHKSLFVGPADRKAVNEGKADYFPIFLYEIFANIKSFFSSNIGFIKNIYKIFAI